MQSNLHCKKSLTPSNLGSNLLMPGTNLHDKTSPDMDLLGDLYHQSDSDVVIEEIHNFNLWRKLDT